MLPMMDDIAAPICSSLVPEAASVAASVAAPGAGVSRPSGERIEVVLASDQRRQHPVELRSRLVAEMMMGRTPVSELSRHVGICTSVLHRWLRQARMAAGEPVASAPPRMLAVRVAHSALAAAAWPGAGLEVVLGNGRVLRVPAGADPAQVTQLAAALER